LTHAAAAAAAACRTRFLSAPALLGISGILAAYFVTVVVVDARVKGHRTPLHSVGEVLFGR
jgi:hypothetical protein